MTVTHGHCLCGAIRFEVEGDTTWCGHCHCESCRRTTSSPVTTFFNVRSDQVSFSGDAPKVYESSPGVRRTFCGKCGSPLGFETYKRPGEIDLYVASLDKPESMAPMNHVHDAERLPWLDLADALPRFPHSSE